MPNSLHTAGYLRDYFAVLRSQLIGLVPCVGDIAVARVSYQRRAFDDRSRPNSTAGRPSRNSR